MAAATRNTLAAVRQAPLRAAEPARILVFAFTLQGTAGIQNRDAATR